MTKKHWKSGIGIAASCCVVLAVAGTVHAGWSTSEPVFILADSDGTRYASGVFRHARASANTNESIGCRVVYAAATHRASAYCAARTAAGRTLSCFADSRDATAQQALADLIGAMHPDAMVKFTVNGEGYCSSISVRTDSGYVQP